ncbi:MAG: hypothetical protein KatS3mg108_0799 [Isosphaeraceae bacterium]|jgi:predicted CXXCH cytochrome family protein|nr:MAG: hypothetical protein KatS3mg108_0799 [Isosphaeraceae bacterium]
MADETGKQRRSRIELTYYRRPDALTQRRRALAALAVAAALLWLVLAPLWDGRRSPRLRWFQWDRMASPGPLAHAHAAWTDDCGACHAPFVPIDGSDWSPWPVSFADQTSERCQKCHLAGPHHPVRVPPAQVPSCAACHRDHQGSEAQLTRMSDALCTGCHANLSAVRAEATGVADRITAFDAEHHPRFGPLAKPDPGRLHFNHALHLAPGLTLQDGGRPWTVDRLAEPWRTRYAAFATAPDSPITLSCSACHEPDDRGALMKPVAYEQHCAGCHPLGFDPGLPERQVTHGRTPAEVVAELRAVYSLAVVEANDDLLARRIPDRYRTRPGRPVETGDRSAAEARDAALDRALRILFGTATAPAPSQGGCLKCHDVADSPPLLQQVADYERIELAPTSVPAVWLTHARFDHQAHRAWDCARCHESARRSTTHRDLLLPDRDQCLECHAPAAATAEGQPLGGVDASCTECHSYHQGHLGPDSVAPIAP